MGELSAVLAGLGVAATMSQVGPRGLRRLAPVAPPAPRRVLALAWLVESAPARSVACVVAAVCALHVLAGGLGAVLGAPAGLLLSWWIGKQEPPSRARAREQARAELPLAVDLMAACAAAGRPPRDFIRTVSRALRGPLAEELALVAARLELGVHPATEWRRLSEDPLLGPLGRTLARSFESGAPLVDGLCRLADDQRLERRTRSQLRARAVGVKAAAPLALCFLPAFMLVGVVPTIAATFEHLL